MFLTFVGEGNKIINWEVSCRLRTEVRVGRGCKSNLLNLGALHQMDGNGGYDSDVLNLGAGVCSFVRYLACFAYSPPLVFLTPPLKSDILDICVSKLITRIIFSIFRQFLFFINTVKPSSSEFYLFVAWR